MTLNNAESSQSAFLFPAFTEEVDNSKIGGADGMNNLCNKCNVT